MPLNQKERNKVMRKEGQNEGERRKRGKEGFYFKTREELHF